MAFGVKKRFSFEFGKRGGFAPISEPWYNFQRGDQEVTKMKTMKQIADELKIDKQRIYRYIKKHHITEAHQMQGVMYFSDAVQTQIEKHFLQKTTSGEAYHTASSDAVTDTVIAILKSELEIKNQLISEQQQTIRILSESIKADRQNDFAGTLIDGQQKFITDKKPARNKRFPFSGFFKNRK